MSGPAAEAPSVGVGGLRLRLDQDGTFSLNTKLTLTPASSAEDVDIPSDDAIRQALLRMGSGSRTQRQHRPDLPAAPNGETRRRRFSQNEHVPVEYVGRDRGGSRAEPAEVLFSPPPPDQSGLERALDRERQARELAEREATELKTQLQGARTRIAHLEIELGELRATRAAEAAATAVAISNAAGTTPVRDAAVARPRGRPRLRRVDEDDEQEPVKWWTD